MADYLHGAYGIINTVGNRVAEEAQGAFVYVGTAPVHTIEGGAKNVNVPILVNNIAEARKYFGYSDDWASYTLCEAIHVHLETKGVGPLVLINVLDPDTHKSSTATTADKTPDNGIINIVSAASIILDTVEIYTKDDTPVKKIKGTDYTIDYNADKETITIKEIGTGLGTSALSVSYYTINPAAVTATTVIGTTDDMGENTGIYAIKDVYQLTGHIPSFLLVPGFSSVPAVHAVMYENSTKVNGHWDVFMFTDIPILDGSTPVTLATAATWKVTNGYNKENEKTFFPLAEGTDGNIYHISVLAAANLQELLIAQDGIPYRTSSNTECGIIKNLYMGASNAGRVFDDELINEKLNKNGIASAVFTGGRWAIWGAHCADYDQANGTQINVSETNRMMLFYISNDFQQRRSLDVDKPLSTNDIRAMVSEEQARLDALVNMGALIYGVVVINASADTRSDIINGDWSFAFTVTTTPLAKSLTAIVTWTDDGFATYFEE